MKGMEYLASKEKRRLDITTSLGALSVGAIPFAASLTASCVASKSLRPIFVQARKGYQDEMFNVYKLRTLNDAVVASTEAKEYGTFDPRAGKIGTMLRVTGIDEFPQLLNIVEGSMSFVGPRPVPAPVLDRWRESDPILFDEWLDACKAAKAGLISPGTLIRKTTAERSDDLFASSMRADMDYIDNATLGQDLKLIGSAALKVAEMGLVLAHLKNTA